jgi:glycosidase
MVFGMFSCENKINNSLKQDSPEFVPQWAKKVVWYQVFPERFRNGDKTNDPRLKNQINSWPFDQTSPWEISAWNSDWYEYQPWEKENGKDIWYNIQRRRYGGDLQGIIDKLDYIKEMGFGAIYLNPVFMSPSLHKYDQASYHHVDPNFGPDPEGDRKQIASEVFDDPKTWVWTSADLLALKLIREVHARGMKIIFDGVFNHVGMNFPAFRDVVKNQEKSKYKNWFTVKSWDNVEKGTKFDYDGWFGIKQLPELREDSMGIVHGPREYIFAATKRWMNPEPNGQKQDGIDGWRLDVAFCVNHNFWKEWRKQVKSFNPEAYITGEIVDSISKNQEYLKGDEFDGVMNYNFMMNVSEYFINQEKGITTSEFDRKIHELLSAYPGGAAYTVQNLMDSHDTQRLLSFIKNRDIGIVRDWGKGFFDATKGSNPKYNSGKPTENDIKILKLIVVYQMTCLGAPMVYYGDEIGMWGANDPCCRKPMIWDDIQCKDEVFNADGSKRSGSDKVEADKELRDFYKKIITVRNKNIALQLGNYKTIYINDAEKIYAFERSFQNQKIIIILNNSEEIQNFELPINETGSFIDMLNTMKTYKVDKNKIAMTTESLGYKIIKKQ